jgi:hypothetical protein
MRTNEPVRSLWGIAFFGFGLVILLVGTVAISLLAMKVWVLDDVPVSVKVLLLLGAALMAIGGLCYMASCVRSQVDGLVPRPRYGVLALGPSRSISFSLVLECAAVWMFAVGILVRVRRSPFQRQDAAHGLGSCARALRARMDWLRGP